MENTIKTESQLRRAFWQGNEALKAQYKRGKRQNDYNATIRSEWGEFIDMMVREGLIPGSLADRATL